MCRSQRQAQEETLSRTEQLIWGSLLLMGSWVEEEVVVKGKNRRIRQACIYSNYAEDAEQKLWVGGQQVRVELPGV